ncbi:MAG: UDP-N-acetylmuramate dehydrogenase [Desulfocapsaceae bacterium]|nr:UDP-N-acetylmuramate dehydrogenase [Desulfocapsaceae bacterium]
MDSKCKNILQTLLSTSIQWDCPLSAHTSFGIGGPVEALVKVMNVDELMQVMEFVSEHKISWRVIGRGTNILVNDKGFNGLALVLAGDFKDYSFDEYGETTDVKVGAGAALSRLSSLCIERGLAGIEFAMGIPGTVGGAVLMNAGAWGGAIADILQGVELVSAGNIREYTREEVQFGYRSFNVAGDTQFIVTSAVFRLSKADPQRLRQISMEYQHKRKKSQPPGRGCAGSIFKNPEGASAGRLIEECGLKGEKIGDAEVSTQHANFIVNKGQATAEDVLQLMEKIQEEVHRKHGVLLEPEVHVW